MIIDTRSEAEQYGNCALHKLAKFRACLTMKANGRKVTEERIQFWADDVRNFAMKAAHASGMTKEAL